MSTSGVPLPPEYSMMGLWARSAEGANVSRDENNRARSLLRNSIIGDVVTGDPRQSEYAKVFGNENIPLQSKATYVAGRALHDLLTDGSRTAYWLLNHPLGALSVLGSAVEQPVGIVPDKQLISQILEGRGDKVNEQSILREHSERMGFSYGKEIRGIPYETARGVVPLLTAGLLTQLSGNQDFTNLAEGGRTKGYQAILPTDHNNKETESVPLELALRYITGRTGRLLPFQEFSAERPDVSKEDYDAAKMHQWDKGALGLGLFKGTGRNIEGEPEFTMMGFRVPMSAATAALAGLGGAVAGSKIANKLVVDQINRRAAEGNPVNPGGWRSEGHRRVIGAAAGTLTGGLLGSLASRVVNDGIIQPTLYPERVAAEASWPQRRAAELERLAKANKPKDEEDDVPDQQQRPARLDVGA
jgi:hypothetical protein